MIFFPAIDLKDGQCVRLIQGDMSLATVFSNAPSEQARIFQEAGCVWLHVVDLNGAFEGQPVNAAAVDSILKSTEIKVQLGGGIRDRATVKFWLDKGVSRVILGTVALKDPTFVIELCDEFPGQVAVGIDAKDGYVSTKGWTNQSAKLATELATELSQLDIASIITTDIATDGTLEGPNLDAMRLIAEASRVPVIASGGVGSMADLLSLISLEEVGVSGIIVGRALYEKKLDLGEAINALKNDRIRDTNISNEFFA